jgi:hypothetical protein
LGASIAYQLRAAARWHDQRQLRLAHWRLTRA